MVTTIIEQYLLGIDQASFQKIMNHLLHLEGYKFISSPGSVIGKSKTSKGSPDSFFEENDNYVFCEFTTQENLLTSKTFFNKLKSDVNHCFNEEKTGIAKVQITKVILAFTQKITAKEHKDLKKLVKSYNPKSELVIYSAQEIPFRLVYYPGLADKYISGVKTTNGTIYTLPDFLKTTERGLQPSLTNTFTGREEEIEKAKKLLLSENILIITGSQGVGKSKLAVQLAEIYKNELNYEPRVIVSSPVSLWEDLKTFILPTKKYFIFFDDANRALPNLDYLLQFIKDRDKDTLKIVITVRDYVRKELDKYFMDHPYSEIIVNNLEDNQLREIITKSLPEGLVLQPHIMEKVVTLSKGNSRLALMASSSILKNNNIEILKDVFSLYNQYFHNIKTDLSFIDKPNSLKALGILAFFGVIEKNNEELKAILESYFSINWDELWESFIELEKSELVNVFHNEVVKISDQVLATYAFYKTFIEEHSALINYSHWIELFIEKYDQKINKTLIDLINTFGYSELRDRLTSLISVVQKKLEIDIKKLYKFFDIFWFYREVETLLFVNNWIESLGEEKTELKDIKYSFELNDFILAPEYTKLLLNFWHHYTLFTREAIRLSLKLMFKQPSRIPETLKHLKEHLSYHRFDYRIEFQRQITLIEVIESTDYLDNESSIADQIFISLAPSFIGWEYSQIEGRSSGQMAIYNFALIKTDALMVLRKRILEKLFKLFAENEIAVLRILSQYAWTSSTFDSSIYADEQPLISSFFKQNLRPENYSHCKLVFEYMDTLKEHGIEISNDWNAFLNSDSMQIAKIFSSKFEDVKLNHEEQLIRQKAQIEKYVSGKGIDFFEKVFAQLDSIYKEALNNNDSYWIDSNLPYLFITLAESEIGIYLKSLELLMLSEYSFKLIYGHFIFVPLKNKLIKPKDLYNCLNGYEYKQKQVWKKIFFDAVEEHDIDEFFLKEFVGFLFLVDGEFYAYNLNNYIKFDKQFRACKKTLPALINKHSNIITYIIEILLSKAKDVNISFDHKVCQDNFKHFTDNPNLLKQVYYHQGKSGMLRDHHGQEIAAVSILDNNFILEYLNKINQEDSHDLKYNNVKFSFIWDLPKYQNILDKALNIIISKSIIISNFEHEATVFFRGLKSDEAELEKAYNYISGFISKHFKSKKHICIIFNVVTYCFNNQVLRFLKEFLLLNKDPEFIKNIWLERNDGIVGSFVPGIEAHITFLKSLIEMCQTLPNPLEYGEHIKHWGQEIEWAKQNKESEMKRDFAGWI